MSVPLRNSTFGSTASSVQSAGTDRKLAKLERSLMASELEDAEQQQREHEEAEMRKGIYRAKLDRQESMEVNHRLAMNAEKMRLEQDQLRGEIARAQQQKRDMVSQRQRALIEERKSLSSARSADRNAKLVEVRQRKANQDEREKRKREHAYLAKAHRVERMQASAEKERTAERNEKRRQWEMDQSQRRAAVLRQEAAELTARLERAKTKEELARQNVMNRKVNVLKAKRQRDTFQPVVDEEEQALKEIAERDPLAAAREAERKAAADAAEEDVELVLDAQTLQELQEQFDRQLVAVLQLGVRREEARKRQIRVATDDLDIARRDLDVRTLELQKSGKTSGVPIQNRNKARKHLALTQRTFDELLLYQAAQRKRELRQLAGFHRWFAERQREIALSEAVGAGSTAGGESGDVGGAAMRHHDHCT